MKCIVGLGNPGRKYTYTRHNIGFLVLSEFENALNLEFREHGFSDVAIYLPKDLGSAKSSEEGIVFVRPGTFMNMSGKAVEEVFRDFDFRPQDLIVIHDDLDLPFGKVRIKRKGSSGGHRGVESICSYLGTSDFARVKVGIGRPPTDSDTADYVLDRFSSREKDMLPTILTFAKDAAWTIVYKGIDEAMSQSNGKDLLIDGGETG
jgi:PTH1 family peptidyl-tRNA hydrolase